MGTCPSCGWSDNESPYVWTSEDARFALAARPASRAVTGRGDGHHHYTRPMSVLYMLDGYGHWRNILVTHAVYGELSGWTINECSWLVPGTVEQED